MPGTIVQRFGKQRVVCGLRWFILGAQTDEEAKQEIKAQSEKNGSQFGVPLDALSGAQIRRYLGVVPRDAPKDAREAVSAAAWLSLAIERPTLLVGEISQGRYWLVFSYPSGEIDIDTDVIVDATDIGDRVDRLLEQILRGHAEGLDVVVSGHDEPPGEMLRSGSIAYRRAEFAELVVGTPADARVRCRQLAGVSRTSMVAAAAGVVLLAAAIGGYLVYEHIQAQREAERELAEAQAQQANAAQLKTLTDLRIREAVQHALETDTATPWPATTIDDCTAVLDRVPTRAGGWLMEQVSCAGAGQASVNWLLDPRGGGNNTLLLAAGHQIGSDANVGLTASGATATMSVQRPSSPARPALAIEQLPKRNVVLAGLGSATQIVKQAYTWMQADLTEATPKGVQFEDPAKAKEQNKMSPVPPDMDYKLGTFRASGRSLSDLSALRATLNYGFVTVKQLTLKPQVAGNGALVNWTLEGSYVVANH